MVIQGIVHFYVPDNSMFVCSPLFTHATRIKLIVDFLTFAASYL